MAAAQVCRKTSSPSYLTTRPSPKPAPSKTRALGIAPLALTPREERVPATPARQKETEFRARLAELVPELRRWANRLTDHGPEAMDLVQETCRKGLEAHAQFTTGDDLKPWLFRILRNLHIDQRRRAWRVVCLENIDQVVSCDDDDDDAQPLWRSVSDEQMAQALERLPPLYRHVYVLRAVDGLSYGEMAQQLGISLNTVGTRLIRARQRLRSSLMAELTT